MYIDCLAAYFTTCVWHKLYDSDVNKYRDSLLAFKRGMLNDEMRKRVYESVANYYATDANVQITGAQFVNNTVCEFFVHYSINGTYAYELFDKIMTNTLNVWLTYVYSHLAESVVKKCESKIVECKTHFVRYLSVEIDKFVARMVGDVARDERIAKLLEVNDHLQWTIANSATAAPTKLTVDVGTQVNTTTIGKKKRSTK